MTHAGLFGGHAADYARHRPRYPAGLFSFLASVSPGRALAWDCATGNGQAALGLVEWFDVVVATDASPAQVAQAEPHARIRYAVGSERESGLADRSADLVTVAQALHWLDVAAFYAEASRVLRPGGLVAAWCYGLVSVDPVVDRIVHAFDADVVGSFWPPERRHVDAQYRTLPFPFAQIAVPVIPMEREWSADDLIAYIGTWSAVKRFQQHHGTDPMPAFAVSLRRAWPEPHAKRVVRWPLTVRVGRVG